MGLVIDTSALVAMERAGGSWSDKIGTEPAALPAIVYAELLVGVELAGNAGVRTSVSSSSPRAARSTPHIRRARSKPVFTTLRELPASCLLRPEELLRFVAIVAPAH